MQGQEQREKAGREIFIPDPTAKKGPGSGQALASKLEHMHTYPPTMRGASCGHWADWASNPPQNRACSAAASKRGGNRSIEQFDLLDRWDGCGLRGDYHPRQALVSIKVHNGFRVPLHYSLRSRRATTFFLFLDCS